MFKKLVTSRNKKKGFTLIELIVVIAILGILAAIGTPIILGQVAKANDQANASNAGAVYNAAQLVCVEASTGTEAGTAGTITLAAKLYSSTTDSADAFIVAVKSKLTTQMKGSYEITIKASSQGSGFEVDTVKYTATNGKFATYPS